MLVIHSNDYFYDLRHQAIWDAMLGMWEQGIRINVPALHQFMKDRQEDEGIGGYPYLSTLPDCIPAGTEIDYYLETLKSKYVLRKLLTFGAELVEGVYESEANVDGYVDLLSSKFYAITERKAALKFKTAKVLVDRAMETLEAMAQNESRIPGLSTGLIDLDQMTGGLMDGDVFVIGGRPNIGKSAIAMNIAEHVCLDLGLSVGVFSMEMSAESLMMRLISSTARVNARSIRDGQFLESDFPKLVNAAGKLRNAKIYIDDSSGSNFAEFRAKSRIMVQKFGVKLLVLDYIQLMSLGSGMKNETRNAELGEISKGIKNTAKQLNIPIVVLSQLSREMDKHNRKPKLSDLRDCGGIEADADMVGMLYKPGGDDDGKENGIPVNLLLAKQRNGPTGDIHLVFMREYTRFECKAKIDDEDIPTPRQGKANQSKLPYKED